VFGIETRDIDTPLSPLGFYQAQSLGHWFGRLPAAKAPELLLCSPYVRAVQTARVLLASAGLAGKVRMQLDERLREKEFGILDRLTTLGIRERYQELSEQRAHVGKFYFRPPGGESLCDVILRLRSLQEMMTLEHGGCRVLVVAHQVIVNCMRYLIEQMDEAGVMDMDRRGDVPNCGVTSYLRTYDAEGVASLQLDLVNFVAPLLQERTPVTSEPDSTTAPNP
jgi:broad specificity phosphatase PhoE